MNLIKYKIPMHIAAALATGRPELVSLTKNPNLDPEAQIELLRLLMDLIAERQREKEKVELMKQVIQQSTQNIEGAAAKLFRTFESFQKVETRDELDAEIRMSLKDRE